MIHDEQVTRRSKHASIHVQSQNSETSKIAMNPGKDTKTFDYIPLPRGVSSRSATFEKPSNTLTPYQAYSYTSCRLQPLLCEIAQHLARMVIQITSNSSRVQQSCKNTTGEEGGVESRAKFGSAAKVTGLLGIVDGNFVPLNTDGLEPEPT